MYLHSTNCLSLDTRNLLYLSINQVCKFAECPLYESRSVASCELEPSKHLPNPELQLVEVRFLAQAPFSLKEEVGIRNLSVVARKHSIEHAQHKQLMNQQYRDFTTVDVLV